MILLRKHNFCFSLTSQHTLGWGYKPKSWPIDSALANLTAFGYTFAIKIVSNPKKKVSSPWVCIWKKWPVLMGKWGKNIKKTRNGQKSLFEVLFWFLRCLFGGFRGYFVLKSGLTILIRALEVPFLVPPKRLKRPYFSHLGGTRNGTSGARIKIVRPLFNTN